MPGRPNSVPALGIDDNAHTLSGIRLVDSTHQRRAHRLTQTVKMLGVLHRDPRNAVVNTQLYRLFHIFTSILFPAAKLRRIFGICKKNSRKNTKTT
jgi:hypothetical protein